jgi:hypothetical protein
MFIAFEPKPGIVRDNTAFSHDRWIDGGLVRFWNGKPQPIGGWAKLFANALTGIPRLIFPLDRSGIITLAYGTSTKLYVGVGSAQPTDRSPVGLPAGITAWSMGAWGSTLLASPKGGTLYEQSGAGTAAEVTQAPNAINRMLATPERQVLALGCNEEISGTFNGLCIRGCDIEDYTDWTTTSTNNAFEHILDGGGQIVAAELIGSYVAIWTETSLHLGQFLGDPGQTYRFDKVDDNSGCAGPDAVTIVGARAYWMGPDLRMRTWAPGELPIIIDNPLSNFFRAAAYPSRSKILVCSNTQFDEVWIFYNGSSASEERSFLAFSIRDFAWFKGSMSRSAVLDSGLIPNILGASYTTTLITAAPEGLVYIQETGTSQDGLAMSWYIESAYQYMDQGERRIMLRSVRPDFSGVTGTVNVELYATDYPQGQEERTKSLSGVGALTKKDFRFSGKLFRLRISGAGAEAFARLGKLTFDAVPMGGR